MPLVSLNARISIHYQAVLQQGHKFDVDRTDPDGAKSLSHADDHAPDLRAGHDGRAAHEQRHGGTHLPESGRDDRHPPHLPAPTHRETDDQGAHLLVASQSWTVQLSFDNHHSALFTVKNIDVCSEEPNLMFVTVSNARKAQACLGFAASRS